MSSILPPHREGRRQSAPSAFLTMGESNRRNSLWASPISNFKSLVGFFNRGGRSGTRNSSKSPSLAASCDTECSCTRSGTENLARLIVAGGTAGEPNHRKDNKAVPLDRSSNPLSSDSDSSSSRIDHGFSPSMKKCPRDDGDEGEERESRESCRFYPALKNCDSSSSNTTAGSNRIPSCCRSVVSSSSSPSIAGSSKGKEV